MKRIWITTRRLAALPTLIASGSLALLLAAGPVGAQTPINAPPALMNFQGRLAKPDGTPVTDGANYSLTLSLWDAQSGGAKRWEQTFTNVAVRNGIFAVLLDLSDAGSHFTSGNNLDSALNNNTYLQVQLGGNPALTPRQQLLSSAYALKAATVPDGSITMSKLHPSLQGSMQGGAAGGDLMGAYPDPQIITDPSLLNKVSGTLLSIGAATTAIDQSQPTVTATVTSSAWQSFKPSSSGQLMEIDVYTGTTGQRISAQLNIYSGQGTSTTPIVTVPITVNPSLGLQSFPITTAIPNGMAVTGGQTYTWSIGSNNNLIFGYASGTPYPNGQADLGAQFDYAFQTRMRVTTAPAAQINATANLFQTGSFYLAQNATLGPMLVKQYDPFIATTGPYIGAGRSGLFQAASDVLFGGMADTGAGARSIRFGTWSADGTTRSDLVSIFNNGNVGIGTTTATDLLTVGGNARLSGNIRADGAGGLNLTGSGAGITFPDGTTQRTAPVFQGATAGGDLTGAYPNPTLATLATSLQKVSGNAIASDGTNIALLDHAIRLRSLTDSVHSLSYQSTWNGATVDGPVLTGHASGVLGLNQGGPQGGPLSSILAWNGSGVNVTGGITASSNITAGNNMYANAVGIGTNSPDAKLHIVDTTWPTAILESSSTSGTWLSLRNTGSGGNNWNIVSSGSGNAEGEGKLFFNDQTNTNTVMALNNSGEVNVPGFVTINGSANQNYNYGYLNKSGSTGTASGNYPYSLVANQRIAALEFNAFSDVRLKRPLGRSDAARDLDTLLGIEVTDYTMRDTIAYGSQVHKKVLAQQVESVYPQAVKRATGVIPDIYQRARVDHGWVQIATNLKVGERVQLLTPRGSAVYGVLDATPQGFRVELLNADEVFVYGREVADLRTVDYEAIAMLNVSATQALYRQLDDLKARSVESETSLAKMKAHNVENETALVEMKAKNADMETRLAAIEAALKQLKPTLQPAVDKPSAEMPKPRSEAGK